MMKLQKMKKYSFLLVFFIGVTCFSQNHKGSFSLIKEDGLHKIMLTSEVRAACQNDFNFLRINDSRNQEIPYVLKQHSDRLFATFLPIKILKKNSIKDSITAILIENKKTKELTNLILQIANTNISKRYDLYGSNNAKKWFGISSNNSLNLTNEGDKLIIEKRINFPTTTYKFLKIEFNDKNSLPINILGVGIYTNKYFSEEPIVLMNYTQEIIQLKDRKVTQIKFKANNQHKINCIYFDIKPTFFLRNAKLIAQKQRKIKKRVETYEKVISTFRLSSKKENTIIFNNFHEKEFKIEIDNQDNPPLAITNVKLLQKPIYLISNLKKGQKYKIVIDTTLSKPSYDLGNFITENTKIAEGVSIQDFSKIKNKQTIIKGQSFWKTKVFMWVCIIFVSLLIVYFALDLLKDLKHKEKK